MAEEINMTQAKEVYATLLRMLDNQKWNYEKEEEKLLIRCGLSSEDFPVEFIVVVKPDKEVVQFLSKIPCVIPEDKRAECAIAVCIANYGLCDGSFDYNISDGTIVFRMTSSYRESLISEKLFEYMIFTSAWTVDKYNDRFFMYAKGMMTLQDFIKKEKE